MTIHGLFSWNYPHVSIIWSSLFNIPFYDLFILISIIPFLLEGFNYFCDLNCFVYPVSVLFSLNFLSVIWKNKLIMDV